MTALIGVFAPGAASCQTRTVELEGQPTWILIQMRWMWSRTFRQATDAMVAELLARDWLVLAGYQWRWQPVQAQADPLLWWHVAGVGWAHLHPEPGQPRSRRIPADPPEDGEEWAYLWEHDGAALHVYVAARARWHHIATLPEELFAALTLQLTCDVEERRDWVEDQE